MEKLYQILTFLCYCVIVKLLRKIRFLSHNTPHKDSILYILHSCRVLCGVLIWDPGYRPMSGLMYSCLQIPLGMFLLLYPWVTLDMYLYTSRHVTSSIWNKKHVRHNCLISCFSQLKRTSNGVKSFPHVAQNLLPPLDIHILDNLSAKCLILLFEGVKSILPDGYPC